MKLTVSVDGLDTIDQDFSRIQQELAAAVQASMASVGAFMKDALQRHIETDVYNAYTPKVYPRRSETPAFGAPLSDMEANTAVNNRGAGVTLTYLPSGTHSGTTADLPQSSSYYNPDNPRPIKPNPVHGDNLIRRIETGQGYDWDTDVPARPFWQNFVNEMEGVGGLFDAFAAAMAAQGFIVTADGGMVEPDAADRTY